MLTNPLALVGLAAVPALLTVYLLRNRVKHRVVSSLMLWTERTRMTTGGSKIQRARLPLLFFLELLIILLLVWAAANPLRLSRRMERPLIVVLDDSASMAAAGFDGRNAVERALKKLPGLARKERFSPIRFIVAGDEPRWLGEDATRELLRGRQVPEWNPRAASFHIEKALLLAREQDAPSTKLLVISDALPEKVPSAGELRWLAFGTPAQNTGFVNAVRGGERCMVDIAGSGRTELELRMGDQSKTVTVELPSRKIYKLTDPSAMFEAILPPDELAIDNHITLLPEPEPRVRVEQSISHPELSELVNRSIEATGMNQAGPPAQPELLITDSSATVTNQDTWVLHLLPAADATPFTGPFVVDRDSPLTTGISFEGIVWPGLESRALPGMPVVMAGNTPLLTQQDDPSGRPRFYLQIDPALSTLQHSPAWPTLFWNLLRMRAAAKPGFKEANLRPGMEPAFTGNAELERPVEPGIFEVESDGERFRAAYNFLDAGESDLSTRGAGDEGSWLEPESVEREYTELAPLLAMVALALLVLHQYLARREQNIVTGKGV